MTAADDGEDALTAQSFPRQDAIRVEIPEVLDAMFTLFVNIRPTSAGVGSNQWLGACHQLAGSDQYLR
jgi:hypothetical protein